MKVGSKIKFDSEVQRYTVQAHDARFAVMTKPFSARRTCLYTITDLQREVRGPINQIFGINEDVNNAEGAQKLLLDLQDGLCAVSHRRDLPLTDREIEQLKPGA